MTFRAHSNIPEHLAPVHFSLVFMLFYDFIFENNIINLNNSQMWSFGSATVAAAIIGGELVIFDL